MEGERAHDLRVKQAQALAAVLQEIDVDDPILETWKNRYGASNGGDNAALHGLPAIGRGVTGAMRDTNPEQALMAKQSRRRHRRHGLSEAAGDRRNPTAARAPPDAHDCRRPSR